MDGAELIQAQAYARPVVRGILKDYPDDVEDILQSAAVKAWQHQQDFHNQSKLDTWFTKIAIRESLMMLRSIRGRAKQIRPKPIPIDDKVFSIRDPRPRQDTLLLNRERNENILKKVLTLEPDLRRIALEVMQSDEDVISGPSNKYTRIRLRGKLKPTLERISNGVI